MEDLVGTCSTIFSGGLFWDQFLLDLIKKFFWCLFLVQIDVLLFLPQGLIYAKSSNFYAKLNVSNLNVSNLNVV